MHKFKADVFNCKDNGPCIRLLIKPTPNELKIDLLELEAAADLINFLKELYDREILKNKDLLKRLQEYET